MTCVSLMEWNPKASNNNLQWDWENLIMYNNNENPNQRKLDGGVDWEIDGGGDSSIPDLGLASSKSASATSSPPGESKLEKENGEPLLGLKLGKRTYFEDSSAASSSAPVTATASASAASLTRRSKSNLVTIFCQVEGCNLDLSAAKDYHRKHRVCENHSKCPKVVVAGLERRFCQQCSRFHGLLEFDEKKRSCRKRLSDHNARRRKPQGETLRFNPSRLHSSIYGSDERRERMMSYGGWESRNPLFHHERGENGGGYLLWEDTPPSSNFTITRECSSGSQQLLGNQPTIASVTAHLKAKGIVTPEASSTRGMEDESAMSRRAGDATQDLQRSHSLLSTNSSWGSCEPPSMMTSLETVHTAGLPQSLPEMTHIGLPPVEPYIRPFNPSHAGYLGDNNPPHLKGPYSAEFF